MRLNQDTFITFPASIHCCFALLSKHYHRQLQVDQFLVMLRPSRRTYSAQERDEPSKEHNHRAQLNVIPLIRRRSRHHQQNNPEALSHDTATISEMDSSVSIPKSDRALQIYSHSWKPLANPACRSRDGHESATHPRPAPSGFDLLQNRRNGKSMMLMMAFLYFSIYLLLNPGRGRERYPSGPRDFRFCDAGKRIILFILAR
jgi:hypothetical protein